MGVHSSREIGLRGEGIAVRFLEQRGMRVVGKNVFVDRDEIDIIYQGEEGLVAVEVKTVEKGSDPFEALTDEKMRRVRRAASGYRYPIAAIDAIGVALSDRGVEVRWLRRIG